MVSYSKFSYNESPVAVLNRMDTNASEVEAALQALANKIIEGTARQGDLSDDLVVTGVTCRLKPKDVMGFNGDYDPWFTPGKMMTFAVSKRCKDIFQQFILPQGTIFIPCDLTHKGGTNQFYIFACPNISESYINVEKSLWWKSEVVSGFMKGGNMLRSQFEYIQFQKIEEFKDMMRYYLFNKNGSVGWDRLVYATPPYDYFEGLHGSYISSRLLKAFRKHRILGYDTMDLWIQGRERPREITFEGI